MPLQLARRRQRRVARFPIQVVDERGCTSLITSRDQDAGVCRLGDQRRRFARLVAGHLGEYVEQERRARNRRRVQQGGAASDKRHRRRPITSRTAAGKSVAVPAAARSWHSSRA